MALTNRILLVVICASFLLGLGAWLHAQATDTARIVSGSDIGFRIEGRRGNTPIGTFVIKINGQWVPVESAAAPKALTTGN
jgi:hypothetical protein